MGPMEKPRNVPGGYRLSDSVFTKCEASGSLQNGKG
jgi:hypothetical protein